MLDEAFNWSGGTSAATRWRQRLAAESREPGQGCAAIGALGAEDDEFDEDSVAEAPEGREEALGVDLSLWRIGRRKKQPHGATQDSQHRWPATFVWQHGLWNEGEVLSYLMRFYPMDTQMVLSTAAVCRMEGSKRMRFFVPRLRPGHDPTWHIGPPPRLLLTTDTKCPEPQTSAPLGSVGVAYPQLQLQGIVSARSTKVSLRTGDFYQEINRRLHFQHGFHLPPELYP